MWKVLIAIVIIIVLGVVFSVLIGFNQMSKQISVRPWETPALTAAEGTVAIDADNDLQLSRDEAAGTLVNPVPLDQLSITRGAKAYKAYCLSCHGSNLDGFGPVGPSLPGKMVPLDDPEMANKSDGELFWILRNKVNAHPPIGESMSKKEHWDTINYLRSKQQEASDK